MASTEVEWTKFVDEQEKLSAKVIFLSYMCITGLTSLLFVYYTFAIQKNFFFVYLPCLLFNY